MGQQTKLIIILLVMIIILGFIFALQITGVIKKEDNLNITQEEYTNTIEQEDNNTKKGSEVFTGKKFLLVIISILGFVANVVILVGFYKAYKKIGVPPTILKIGLIGLPISFRIAGFLILDKFKFMIMTILIMELIVLLYIEYCYFNCLNMNGSMAILLVLVPVVLSIIKLPFTGFINLIMSIISLVYVIISEVKLARYFNKSQLYAIGIILLPFIFIPILGYSKD